MIHFIKRIFNFFSGSIHRELLISFIFIIFSVIIILGTFSINALIKSNRKIIESNISTNMERLMDDLADDVREIEKITDQIIIHQASQNVINNPVNSPETVVALKKSVFPHLSNLVLAAPLPTSISLVIDSGLIPERILGKEFNDSFFNKFAVYSLKDDDRQNYSRFNSSHVSWSCDIQDYELGTISYGRRILDTRTLVPMGFIMGRIRIEDFFSEFGKLENARTFVFHNDGRLIYSSSGLDKFVERNYGIVLRDSIPGTPWNVITGVPDDFIRQGMNSILGFSFIISLIVLLIAVIFIYLFTRFFSFRIEVLAKAMKSFREGDFSVHVNDIRQDEIAVLSDAFNHVVKDMEQLLFRVKKSERENRRVELNLLKAQINPHFLYNSLSSIGQLSKLGRKDETYKLILALSKFYRLTLNKGNLYIPLGEELQRITSYLEIQKMKYRERLTVVTDFDESITDVMIPDFILQPFLENSFAHGWTEEPLKIHIETESRQDHIYIGISDNGSGMTQKKVHEMLNSQSPSGGFGIYYVRKRLENFYRGKAELNILSNPGEGVTIRIILPFEGAVIEEEDNLAEYYDMYTKLTRQ